MVGRSSLLFSAQYYPVCTMEIGERVLKGENGPLLLPLLFSFFSTTSLTFFFSFFPFAFTFAFRGLL